MSKTENYLSEVNMKTPDILYPLRRIKLSINKDSHQGKFIKKSMVCKTSQITYRLT